ncbi:protein FAM161A [Pieris rapae]|uniref:protein FAM161A n=1 Tax=Pieris rapae TaxID=64459 RepID=UPI001E27E461|nr:protein FAM161A [Pieris rapae]
MHQCSVFKNSCVRVPVDPWSKMPKTAYERNDKPLNASIDSSTTISMSGDNIDTKKLKEFYHSIPDYNDINHLPANEFYSTLKSLREKKKMMLGMAIENIDYDKVCGTMVDDSTTIQSTKCNIPLKKNSIVNRRASVKNTDRGSIKHQARKTNIHSYTIEVKRDDGPAKNDLILKGSNKKYRPKRNQSACSISWHDDKIENKSEVDEKFDKFFDTEDTNAIIDDEFKTQSMPSSPLRSKRAGSVSKHRNVTIPKPFKMTERDEEERIVNELRSLQKSFSEDMLNRKLEKKQFKAHPVPIESRIPLYDKILEDQAMRLFFRPTTHVLWFLGIICAYNLFPICNILDIFFALKFELYARIPIACWLFCINTHL